MMESDLIFDIGMHKGEDTKKYLQHGFRVIAVEANPALADRARVIFKKEILSGKLTVVNLGIADKAGVLPFYRNDHLLEWSSFDKTIGTRNNTPYTVIDIPCDTAATLFEKYGMPYYLKIDIEGYDAICIDSVASAAAGPAYISCEASGIDCLNILVEKGYSQFKLLNQARNFQPFNMDKEIKNPFDILQGKWNRLQLKFPQLSPHQYPYGSSGPFAEYTAGNWMKADYIRNCYHQFYTKDTNQPYNNLSWFDIHAKQ